MLDPVSNKPDFPKMEEEVLARWEANGTFAKSIESRPVSSSFVFYDGPPFATGLPHYGHILAGTIKDVIPRYQTMRGRRVERRFGWDCHGLPVENEMEKELSISGKQQIEAFGVGNFNESCRGIVQRYASQWQDVIRRCGRWVDFDNDYKTMDVDYMESIWWVFKSVWDKGLIYEGHKCMPFCPRCSTPLSNFEVQQAYADVKDLAITVRFSLDGHENTSFLAWTTTPWTLPSNMALTVGPDLDYDFVETETETLIVASALRETILGDTPNTVAKTVRGSELVGETYEPLFSYFSDKKAEGAFRVIAGDFVTTDAGTGIVHTAPGFGEDDFIAGQANGIPLVCPLDMEGNFTDEVPDLQGRGAKEVDLDLVIRLKEEGRLFNKTTVSHSYPHCWRCDTPLLYRAITTWFLEVNSIKEQMIAANKETRWVPSHLRDGRFGNWLEGARDWAISRNRYWGTPLPVWKCVDCASTRCVGSRAELEEHTGTQVDDLHKHFVDQLQMKCDCGGTMERIEEVLDCWFESGAMPYAQLHYPFENKEFFEANFPADFIAEGLDQTRGWFYSLTVLGTALFGCSPFKNVVVNGLVLADDGKKMSKRLRNFTDPLELINEVGADAMRLALMHSPVVRAEDLRFSDDVVRLESRAILIPLWNAYSFFVSYARTDGFDPASDLLNDPSDNPLDRWILSRLEGLKSTVMQSMDAYELQPSVTAFVDFIEDLTNWYIRRSRRRFWKSDSDQDKLAAHTTLYTALLDLSRIIAPYVPFVADAIYCNLRVDSMPESVHLDEFPTPTVSLRDTALEDRMDRVIRAASMGRALRVKHEIKIRQPLSSVTLVTRDEDERRGLEELSHLVRAELNVQTVLFTDNEDDLVTVAAKGNFRALGKRFGKQTPLVAAQIAALPHADIRALEAGESRSLCVGDLEAEVTIDDILLERTQREGLIVENDGTLTVGIETELTDELIAEGRARELISKLQTMRKDADFAITDRISVVVTCSDELMAAFNTHLAYIKAEVLATSFEAGAATEKVDINGLPCCVEIKRA